MNKGFLSEVDVLIITADHLKVAPFDLVFAEKLKPKNLALLHGFTPSGGSSHLDWYLLQVSASDTNRGPMIGQETLDDLTLLLKFRRAVRDNYASELRHSEAFENVSILEKVAVTFFFDLNLFIESFEKTG